jgi:chromate transport protein ChrA
VLIINTVIKLWKSAVSDVASLLIFLAVFALSLFTVFPAAILVAAAGAVGIGLKTARRHSD